MYGTVGKSCELEREIRAVASNVREKWWRIADVYGVLREIEGWETVRVLAP